MATKYVLFRREARHGKVVKSLKPLPSKVNVNMQHFPLFGSGYLAGEFPSGTTTVEGAPVAAEVRALWRSPAGHPADGAVCGSAQSGISGTWIITNLNEDLRYDVVGRKEGFNDVIVAGVTPTSMVDITYSGAVVENETFTGAVGFFDLVGGIPPYSVAAETPLPSGLFPIVDGRNLIIDGTTDADEVASFDVKVTSSNGAEKVITLQLVVGFKAPQNLASEVILDDGVFSVSLTWEVTNSTQQIKVYRSATPFDMDDLPEPIATLSGTPTTYTDDDVIEDDHFYYMVTAVCEQYELRSNVIAEAVRDGDPHWDKVVALLPMDEDGGAVAINEANSGPVVNLVSGATFSSSDSQFASLGSLSFNGNFARAILSENPIQQGESFTIEAWVKITGSNTLNRPHGLWSCNRNSRAGEFDLAITGSGAVVLRRQSGAGPAFNITTDVSTSPLDEWVHVAHTFDGSHQWVFINGIGVIEVADAHGVIPNNVGFVFGGSYIQSYQNYRIMLKGFMDEVRITKGIARYTENFMPPTAQFPNY